VPEPRANAIRWAAVAGPVLVAWAAGATGAGASLPAGAALLLVLVVVAIALRGDRVDGVLASVAAAAAFDYFLTAPRYTFTIRTPADVETAVLLLAVGLAVTGLCHRARRQRSRSDSRKGYLAGIARAARMATEGAPAADLAATLAAMIAEVLDLDRVRYAPDGEAGAGTGPVLHHDGSLTRGPRHIDVGRDGLPTMEVVELPAGASAQDGRFLLTSSSCVRRPGTEQLLVAITLAEQMRRPATGSPAGSAPVR
jgi:K+-sensing histidine kinase KdpD